MPIGKNTFETEGQEPSTGLRTGRGIGKTVETILAENPEQAYSVKEVLDLVNDRIEGDEVARATVNNALKSLSKKGKAECKSYEGLNHYLWVGGEVSEDEDEEPVEDEDEEDD